MAFLGAAVQCEWALGTAQLGVLTSVVFAGQAIGGPLWGTISDGWGRRSALIMSVSCALVFGFATAGAQSFGQLLAFRFFVGLGIQGSTAVSQGLLAEFVPAATRGIFMVAVEGFGPVGTIVQAAFAHRVLDYQGWWVAV